jgi:ATP-dependent Clp protease adaptor protein ClpS
MRFQAGGQDPGSTEPGTGVEVDVETDVKTAEGQPKVAEPPRFAVVLHNDDYTTMEFVIEVLTLFFHLTEEQATQVMLKIHNEGRGVAGVYNFEIAETKANQVRSHAQSKGFPLMCSIEPIKG